MESYIVVDVQQATEYTLTLGHQDADLVKMGQQSLIRPADVMKCTALFWSIRIESHPAECPHGLTPKLRW